MTSKAWVLFLTFFSHTVMAQTCNTAEEYDKSLSRLAKQTQMFSKTLAPSLSSHIEPGESGLQANFYNPYTDKSLGVGGQTMEQFKKANAAKLSLVQRSHQKMASTPPAADQVLSLEQAKSLLTTSTKICKKNMAEVKGPCFLNATHIANEVFQKYPKVPVFKVWMYGSMRNRTNQKIAWNYHVAPAIPVSKDGKIEWLIFDTLLCEQGPLSIEKWVEQTHKNYKFTSKVELHFSGADRVGAFYNTTLKSMRFQKDGDDYERSLIESGKQQH